MTVKAYLISFPERFVRSALGLGAGVARELGQVVLPEGIRRSQLYQNLVDATLRYLIEQVGGVEGVYRDEGVLPDNFLARRTAGNAVEVLGIVAFRASPVWVLAALADLCGMGRRLIPEMADALKAQGLLEKDAQFTSVDEMLDGLERTTSRLAATINTPPLDVAGLRKEWEAIREDARGLPSASLPSRDTISHMWALIKTESARQQRSVFETSSMMAVAAARAVPDGVRWLSASARVGAMSTGHIIAAALLDHYTQTLREIQQVGYVAYAGRQLQPYVRAAVGQFSPKRRTLTQRLLEKLRPPIAATAVFIALAGSLAGQAPAPRIHRLEATPTTVAYGYYWAEARPALRIASGDIIDVDTLLTNTPAGLQRAGVPPEKIQESLKAIVAEVTGDRRGPGGHILTGPVYVEGAQPGDVLEVKILSIDLAIDYGYNGCSGFIPANCDPSVPQKILRLDTRTMSSEFKPGIVVPLRPFFGSMGVAPASEVGRISSNPPGKHAGNLDNRELVAGSTLYIPVFVPGALFEIGDGHAAQGDGEVDQTAIETSLRGRVQLTVRKDRPLVWPRAETSTDYISMASDEDLTVATRVAVQEMVDFLAATKKLTKHEAYQLVSLAGNVAITQLVDRPVYGVHVKMPKGIFK